MGHKSVSHGLKRPKPPRIGDRLAVLEQRLSVIEGRTKSLEVAKLQQRLPERVLTLPFDPGKVDFNTGEWNMFSLKLADHIKQRGLIDPSPHARKWLGEVLEGAKAR